MKKDLLLWLLAVTLVPALSAQTLAPVLLSPAGGYVETAKGSLSWSTGEIAIEEVPDAAAILSQGFQQIEIDTSSVALPNDPKTIKLLIPNVITPNDDGFNDLFDPVGALRDFHIQVSEAQTEMTVVNRWGEVVFLATHPYRAWDGKSGLGVLMPQATYYFILVIHGSKDVTVKGTVHLLR